MLLMLQVCLYTGVQEVGGASSEHKACSLHLKLLRRVDVVEYRVYFLLNDSKGSL